MLIFVMLLISTALMYYYFQRTRALQREISALKSGRSVAVESDSGLWDWLPWNSGEQANSEPVAADRPASTPTAEVTATETAPVEVASPVPAFDESQMPQPGAVSTPRPMPVDMSQGDSAAIGGLNLNTVTTQSLELDPVAAEVPAEEKEVVGEGERTAADSEGDQAADEPAQAETEVNESREPIRSMYDELPPVRVRSPRQNRE